MQVSSAQSVRRVSVMYSPSSLPRCPRVLPALVLLHFWFVVNCKPFEQTKFKSKRICIETCFSCCDVFFPLDPNLVSRVEVCLSHFIFMKNLTSIYVVSATCPIKVWVGGTSIFMRKPKYPPVFLPPGFLRSV